MDFGLTEEQRMLEQTLRDWLAEQLPIARVREIAASESGQDPAVWKGLAELGMAGLLVDDEDGGGGLTLLDAALAMQSFAHAAAPVPYLGSSIVAPLALRLFGTESQRRSWLPGLAAGTTQIGVALGALTGRRGDAHLRIDGGRLAGSTLFAIDTGAADAFLVALDRDHLVLVPRDAAGLTVTPLVTIDRTRRVAELTFDGVVPADWLGGPAGVAGAGARVLAAGRVAVAADALGAAERALEMAVAYAQQREQFGRPIGSFQAVKHMCAEMVAELEPARALVWYAAYAFDHRPEEALLVAAHAKAHLAEVATAIVRTATEVYGGYGFTDDGDLHLWFKRAGLDRQLFGGPEAVRAEAATLQGLS
jgi:alkylation response protein AidB-like acyl-CoA dehydrogenase